MKILYFIAFLIALLNTVCGSNNRNNNINQNNNQNVDFKPKELPAVKVQVPPVIDGELTDPAWRDAPQGTNFFDRNAGNIQAKDQTTIMMVYTDEAIYVAWYLFDEIPEGIAANVEQDQVRPFDEDWISFTFDPLHTHQFNNRIFFMSNPNGIKFVSHPPFGVPMQEVAELWNVEASIVADGWIVEMEIPWTMVPFPKTDIPITMGINFDRGHHRTGANTWWSKVEFREDGRNDGHWVNVLPPQE